MSANQRWLALFNLFFVFSASNVEENEENAVRCQPGKQYFTRKHGQDGFGCQMMERLELKAFCAGRMENCVYVHTPLSDAHHNYRDDPNFVEFAERFFNLQASSLVASQMHSSCKVKHHYVRPSPARFTPKVRSDLLADYRAGAASPVELTSAADFNCVIYLRRGDMGPANSARLTNGEAIEIVTKLRHSYPNCTVHLFSQGEWAHGTPSEVMGAGGQCRVGAGRNCQWIDADKLDLAKPLESTFADIVAHDPQIRLHLDEDVFGVFDAMVNADVLVIDASKFPLLAARYNPNTVIYNAVNESRLAFPYGGYEKYILGHWKLL